MPNRPKKVVNQPKIMYYVIKTLIYIFRLNNKKLPNRPKEVVIQPKIM